MSIVAKNKALAMKELYFTESIPLKFGHSGGGGGGGGGLLGLQNKRSKLVAKKKNSVTRVYRAVIKLGVNRFKTIISIKSNCVGQADTYISVVV